MLRIRSRDLSSWALTRPRKPLVLRGARQVGKSWLVRNWGAEHFSQVVEVNLERRPEAADAFVSNDPREVLQRLEILLGQRIPADGSGLLFLDEIQAVPAVLAKLRWFAEELPQVPVIAAGSLLDFALREQRFSMPVGRITYVHLEPMGFLEFCHACGEAPPGRVADRETRSRNYSHGHSQVDSPESDGAVSHLGPSGRHAGSGGRLCSRPLVSARRRRASGPARHDA